MRHIIFIFLLIFFFQVANGKEFKAISFAKAGDSYSGVYESRTDLNGDVCALVIVHLPTDNVMFENAVGNIIREHNDYYVYLSPGARRLVLKKTGTESLNVIFGSISDITNLKSGVLYNLDVKWLEGKGLDIKDLPSRDTRLSIDTIMRLPTDIGARRFEVRDANNERCTLLRINLPVSDCIFQGNVGEVTQNINEYLVYLSVSSPELTIICPGIQPLSFKLEDIEPGVTYRVKISGYDTSLKRITPQLKELLTKYDDIGIFRGHYALAFKNNKLGIINSTGVEIIPCIYDTEYDYGYDTPKYAAWYFEYDNQILFKLKKDGKFGMLNVNGNIVIPFEYQRITGTGFKEGDLRNRFIEVWKDGKRGVYDFYGNKIVPCLNADRFFFKENDIIEFYQDDKKACGYYNGEGKLLLYYIYNGERAKANGGIIRYFENGKWNYLDNKGNKINNRPYDIAYAFNEDYAVVGIKGIGTGFINKHGEEVIPLIYSRCWEFEDGLATVEKNRQWGAIDTNNNIVIPFAPYNEARAFNEYGFAPVCKNKKWGVINRKGEEIVPCNYDYFSDFWSFGKYKYRPLRKDGKWGIIDIFGNEVIPFIYKYIDPFSSIEDLIIVQNQEGWKGVISINNEVLIPHTYEYIYRYQNKKIGLDYFEIRKDGKSGLIDKDGKNLTSIKYSYFSSEKNGLARIAIEPNGSSELWGVLDCFTGKEIIPCIYDYVAIGDEDIEIRKNNLEGLANIKGEILIEPIYNNRIEYSNDLALVRKNNKRGFINRKGEVAIPLIYDEASSFKNGFACVSKKEKYGIINTDGKVIVECKYDDWIEFTNGFAKVTIGNKIGLINTLGEEIWFGDH